MHFIQPWIIVKIASDSPVREIISTLAALWLILYYHKSNLMIPIIHGLDKVNILDDCDLCSLFKRPDFKSHPFFITDSQFPPRYSIVYMPTGLVTSSLRLFLCKHDNINIHIITINNIQKL